MWRSGLLATMLASLVALPAHAAAWHQIGNPSLETPYYVYADQGTFQKTGKNTYRMWFKQVLNPYNADVREKQRRHLESTIYGPDFDISAYTPIDIFVNWTMLVEVDTKDGRVRALSSTAYDAHGNTIAELTKNYPDEWGFAVPESYGAMFVQHIQRLSKTHKNR